MLPLEDVELEFADLSEEGFDVVYYFLGFGRFGVDFELLEEVHKLFGLLLLLHLLGFEELHLLSVVHGAHSFPRFLVLVGLYAVVSDHSLPDSFHFLF